MFSQDEKLIYFLLNREGVKEHFLGFSTMMDSIAIEYDCVVHNVDCVALGIVDKSCIELA